MHAVVRQLLRLMLVAAVGHTSAFAQERPAGASRLELGAFPGGSVVFTRNGGGDQPDFANYTIGTSFTWNVNRWIGAEAEGFLGIGGRKSVVFDGQTLQAQAMPDVLAYAANVLVSPAGSDRPLVPYLTSGLGALQLVPRDGTERIGISRIRTLFTANMGGGVKWHVSRDLGLRVDYRLTTLQASADAPAFFGHDRRYAHRIYTGVFTTF